MSFVKTRLKLARESIGRKDFVSAHDAANQVLEYEPENYNAHVFLALALFKLDQPDKSEQIYRKAIDLCPENVLAWQGITQFYEQVGNFEALVDALKQLALLHAKTDDAIRLAEVLKKIVDISRSSDDKAKLVDALSNLLSESPFYRVLSNLPPLSPTNPTATTIAYIQSAVYNDLPVLKEIIDIIEKQEKTFMNKEIERRRTRLGAGTKEHVSKQVGREIWAVSRLPHLYTQVMNHPKCSDDLLRVTESKLLQYKVNYLHTLPITDGFIATKGKVRAEVNELVRGAILLQLPDEFVWMLYMEEQDCENMCDYDFSLIRQMIRLLPGSPLARAFANYLRYTSQLLSDEIRVESESQDKKSNEDLIHYNLDEDPFDNIMNIYALFSDKVVISRITSEVYLHEGDYENAIKAAKNGIGLLSKIEQNIGATLPRSRVGFQAIWAISLVHLFPPKHHGQALPILREALSVSPNNIRCLFAHAYIFQTAADWIPAAEEFEKICALTDDSVDGLKAWEEQAWCHWQATHDEADIQTLRTILDRLDDDLQERDQDAARCLWRIGRCHWDQEGKSREEAYPYFIKSLERDPTFAPAFTSLGLYYAEVAIPPDFVRASKCYQKAFEIDPRENVAARKLAEGFAEDREWDLVEVVAKRTIEGEGDLDVGTQESNSSANHFVPTNAWAWKAVGIIELNRQNYPPAIRAFQIALRAEPADALAWSRLGEAYSRAGRHAAAIKSLDRALQLDPQNWFCTFLVAELKIELGLFQEAIFGLEKLLEKCPIELSILVALARAHLSLGQTEYQEGFHARAESSFLQCLEVTSLINEHHPGFRSIGWKLISDAAFQLSRQPTIQDHEQADKISGSLRILLSSEHNLSPESSHFTESADVHSPLTFLGVSIRVCRLRINLNASSNAARGSAWYDLAIGLQRWCDQKMPAELETQSEIVDAITNALKEEPTNNSYWTAYGNAHFSDQPEIAQHAYIKALELDPKNVIAWTNLGFLYYHHADLELAKEAFSRAQVTDPDYSLAWLGQALVAIANGEESDAQTLLTHAASFATGLPDVDIEYSIQIWKQSKLPRRRTEAKEDLIPCFFALDRYCSRRPRDPSGLHLFSLICERLGHFDLAFDLVTRAISILEAIYEESENEAVERHFMIANTSLGRLLLSRAEYARSLESFQTALGLLAGDQEESEMSCAKETKIIRIQAYLGLALGQFMLRDYQSSLVSSQEALSLAGDDLTMKGQIVVLFAQTLWALNTDETKETAKSQLLEYIAVDPENLVAINTLAGMGILTGDANLIDATLSEVRNLPIDRRQELDTYREVEYLLVQHHLSLNQTSEAVSVAQKEIFSEPGKFEPRIRLATLLFRKGEQSSAQALLSDAIKNVRNDLALTSDALTLHSIALCAPGATARDKAAMLREVQRAIMLRPWHVKPWQALAYIRSWSAT